MFGYSYPGSTPFGGFLLAAAPASIPPEWVYVCRFFAVQSSYQTHSLSGPNMRGSTIGSSSLNAKRTA